VEGLWTTLKPEGLTPEETKTRRDHAVQRAHEKVNKERQDKATKKREEHYKLVQKQLEVERAARAEVEEKKEAEKRLVEVCTLILTFWICSLMF
jgi:hypothetical protein